MRCPVGDDIKWRSCQEVQRLSRRCNFNDLLRFLDGLQKGKSIVSGGDENTRLPDIESTAAKYYDFRRTMPGRGGSAGTVPNYPPEKFLKDSNGEYNAMLKAVGDKVAASASFRNKEPALFSRFADCSDKIYEARTGDHGPFLVEFFGEQDFIGDSSKPMQLKTMPVGPGQNPVDSSEAGKWITVDVEGTRRTSTLDPVDTAAKIDNTFEDFYKNDKAAKNHREVIRSFDGLSIKVKSC